MTPTPEFITQVISEVVRPDRIAEYEAWTKELNQVTQTLPGFQGVEVIRPRDHDHPEYVVIIKFDNYTNFRSWMTSPIYHQWLEKGREFIIQRSVQELPSGIELWFSLPQGRSSKISQPSYYKKVILGVLAVYPLILLSNAVLEPFLTGFHPLLALLISVAAVSALLTYPVMPWLTKALSFWLYPSVSKSRRTH